MERTGSEADAASSEFAIRLDRITLENFRGFQNETFPLTDFTVVFGENGSGKSTLLDAVMFPFAPLVERFAVGKDKSLWFRANDVRIDPASQSRIFPVQIDIEGSILGETSLPLVVRSDADFAHWLSFDRKHDSLARKLHAWSAEGNPLPLFARFPADRSFRRPDQSIGSWTEELRRPALRVDGYENCFDSGRDADRFVTFFAKQALVETKRTSVALQAVTDSIRRFFPNFESSSFDVDAADVLVDLGEGWRLPFHSLSDGQRGLLGIVADLAIRCTQLNPHMGAAAPQETNGVVVIDEIDLHLHPKWQRSIVTGLRAAFPLVNFIVSTHSPVVLTEVHAENVLDLDLDPADESRRVPATYGKPAGWVLEAAMGAEERPHGVTEQIAAVERLLQAESLDEASTKLEELRATLGDDDPAIQGLVWELADQRLDAAQD